MTPWWDGSDWAQERLQEGLQEEDFMSLPPVSQLELLAEVL